MYARAVDDAEARLRELRVEERGDLVLAALALGSSVVATQFVPELALPLFLGGLVVGALGMRALWRRWELVERLSGDRDAYVISEVLAHASREAAMERRASFAALIRTRMQRSEPDGEARVRLAADELEALASELEDPNLAFDPAAAVACLRLLTDFVGSPLLNSEKPPEDLFSRVRQIRSGFTPVRPEPDSGSAGVIGKTTDAPVSVPGQAV